MAEPDLEAPNDLLPQQNDDSLRSWPPGEPHPFLQNTGSIEWSDLTGDEGPIFQVQLGDLFSEESETRYATTQSERLRAWKSYTEGQLSLQALRMRADRHRQVAKLKRRQLRDQLYSLKRSLPASRNVSHNADLHHLSEQLSNLDPALVELEEAEEQLDVHEVAIIEAESGVAETIPRLFGHQAADETFKVLVENDYHFAADDALTESVRSSVREELPADASAILSQLQAVDEIEQDFLRLHDPSMDVPLISEHLAPTESSLPAARAVEIQTLQDDWKRATLELENLRNALQAASGPEAPPPYNSVDLRETEQKVDETLPTSDPAVKVFPNDIIASLLETDGAAPVFPPDYLMNDDSPLSPGEYVNRWLLHYVRSSNGESTRYKDAVQDLNLIHAIKLEDGLSLQEFALSLWFDNSTSTAQDTIVIPEFDQSGHFSIRSTAYKTRQFGPRSEALATPISRYFSHTQTSANPGSRLRPSVRSRSARSAF